MNQEAVMADKANGVQRYCHSSDKMVPDPAPDQNSWVRASDYEQLQAKLEAAERQEHLWREEASKTQGELLAATFDLVTAKREREAAEQRVREVEALINSPHNDDWFEGVRIEAAHQVDHWGAEYDVGKKPQDWFWLIGYLGGKALRAAIDGDTDKAKHHTISTAAALRNWHRAISGESNAMRPGIDSTKLEAALQGTGSGSAVE